MKRVRLGFIGGILLALILASLGCGSSSSGIIASPAVSSVPKTVGSLVFQVSTPHQSNKRGAAIPITLTVTNTGTEPAALNFPVCEDFEVQILQAGQPVNTGPTTNGGCGAVVRPVTLAAGATKTYTYNWDQSTSIETFVADGNYTAVGRLLAYQGDLASTDLISNSISIRIAD